MSGGWKRYPVAKDSAEGSFELLNHGTRSSPPSPQGRGRPGHREFQRPCRPRPPPRPLVPQSDPRGLSRPRYPQCFGSRRLPGPRDANCLVNPRIATCTGTCTRSRAVMNSRSAPQDQLRRAGRGFDVRLGAAPILGSHQRLVVELAAAMHYLSARQESPSDCLSSCRRSW